MTDEYASAWIEARSRIIDTPEGLKLSVYFKDPRIADAMRDHFGGSGRIELLDDRILCWSVRGVSATDVLERTAPHMLGNTRRRAEAALRAEAV